VLFSEPKIPQYGNWKAASLWLFGFSALQRAENSSMLRGTEAEMKLDVVSVLFSEPKIPQ